MSIDLIKAVVELQDGFNKQLNPEWVKKDWRWDIAIITEIGECLEHLSSDWKWWKKANLDINQVELELIDILHFAISWQLVQFENNIDETIGLISDSYNIAYDEADDEENLKISRIDELVGLLSSITGDCDAYFDWVRFFSLCEKLDLTLHTIYKKYVAKNSLNSFRQKHGYRDGTYIKNWNGKEDNEVLTEVIEELPIDAHLYEVVLITLESKYPN